MTFMWYPGTLVLAGRFGPVVTEWRPRHLNAMFVGEVYCTYGIHGQHFIVDCISCSSLPAMINSNQPSAAFTPCVRWHLSPWPSWSSMQPIKRPWLWPSPTRRTRWTRWTQPRRWATGAVMKMEELCHWGWFWMLFHGISWGFHGDLTWFNQIQPSNILVPAQLMVFLWNDGELLMIYSDQGPLCRAQRRRYSKNFMNVGIYGKWWEYVGLIFLKATNSGSIRLNDSRLECGGG